MENLGSIFNIAAANTCFGVSQSKTISQYYILYTELLLVHTCTLPNSVREKCSKIAACVQCDCTWLAKLIIAHSLHRVVYVAGLWLCTVYSNCGFGLTCV